MSINNEFMKVKEFHEAFSHPVQNKPTLLDEDRVSKRYSWMLEEIDEFKEAVDIQEQADAMIDLVYFALGTMVQMGVSPEALFDIVHDANMSKIWPDGAPHFNEDGKVIKPEGWTDPEPKINAEIIRQTNA